jgi:hypothetical protein
MPSYHSVCARCALPFSSANRAQRFCSPECWYRSKSINAVRECARCFVTFVVKTRGQRLCSRECRNLANGRPPEQRFWAFVKKSDDSRACWEWQGNRNDSGHGRFSWDGHKNYAHRFSYIIHIGPIPPGLLVRHRCDNPPCVNPSHLLLGTKGDNAQDAKERGLLPTGDLSPARRHLDTVPRGERHPHHKLTWEQVCEIRERYAAGGIMQKELVAEYHSSPTVISMLLAGKIWRQPS